MASPLYLQKSYGRTNEAFEEYFEKAVRNYYDITKLRLDKMKSTYVTGKRNQELDDLIDQIRYEHLDPTTECLDPTINE